MDNPVQIGGAGCCGVIILLLIIGLFNSFDSLEVTELGLDFSRVTYQVDDTQFYTNGRRYLGFGHKFLKFPGRVQTIQFSNDAGSNWLPLRSRTSDGLEVRLEVSLQYQLVGDKLVQVYNKFGQDFEKVYILLAIDELTLQATYFNASTIFTDRLAISNQFKTRLTELFEEEAFCVISDVQLRTVSLPSNFEEAIQETQVKNQDKETAKAERQNQVVSAETQVLQAQRQKTRVIIAAEAEATTIELNNNAYIRQFSLSQELQAERLGVIYEQLGRDPTLLQDYLHMRAIRDHRPENSVINIGSAKKTEL